MGDGARWLDGGVTMDFSDEKYLPEIHLAMTLQPTPAYGFDGSLDTQFIFPHTMAVDWQASLVPCEPPPRIMRALRALLCGVAEDTVCAIYEAGDTGSCYVRGEKAWYLSVRIPADRGHILVGLSRVAWMVG